MKLKEFYCSPLVYSVNGKIATLLENIKVILETDCGEHEIIVKKGFKWNGNSGAFPCRFHKNNERYNVSILVHDVLYHDLGWFTKNQADDILRGCLRESGYGRLMAGAIHRAVTWFGGRSFGSVEWLVNLTLLGYRRLR